VRLIGNSVDIDKFDVLQIKVSCVTG
jgi:hypothetical protein